MKNLLLCGSALMLSLGTVNGQGWESTGVHDDFATSTQYVDGLGKGAYWNSSSSALVLTRPGDGTLLVTATSAGGCTTANSTCYPTFAVDFGTINSLPVTIDLTTATFKDLEIDIENMTNKATYISIIIQDVNGKEAKIEPNVSDLTANSTWNDPERKALYGFSFGDMTDAGVAANVRKTITIDLSSVAGKIGGLTAGAYNCGPGPYNCPVTTYDIDPTQIKAILFMVNFGKDNIFLTEGKTTATPSESHTDDTFIDGANISSYTGSFKIHNFKLGSHSITTGVNDVLANSSLNVYPNPANDVLNVSFDAAKTATVTLTDLFGRTIQTIATNAGVNNITMNTADLATGMYILNVTTENGTVSTKVSVK